MRRFLNAGFRRGAKFLRCVGQGAAIEAKRFPAFCPKALAGIGRSLPDTVLDRSIPIELERQSRDTKAERFREREAKIIVAPIHARLEALPKRSETIEKLRASRPVLPEQLNDRAQDITEPLLAIADLAGGHWPENARSAFVKLYGQEEDEDKSVKLLAAILRMFDEKQVEKLSTQEIITELVASGDQWAPMFEDLLKHDKLQTAASRLARLLKDYRKPDGGKLRPHKIRIEGGTTAQGFYRSDFERAWARNLDNFPPFCTPSGTSGTSEQSASFTSEKSLFHFR